MEMKREAQYRQAEENAARARQLEQQVEDLRRQAEKEKLRDDATQQRKQVACDAFQAGDDLVRELQENAARRKQEREQQRKKEREAARERQWQKFKENQKPPRPEPGTKPAYEPTGFPSAASRPAPGPRPRSSSPAPEANPSPRPPPARFSSFAEFDAYWARFEQRVSAAGTKDIRITDIPWPTTLLTISGVSTSDALDVRKRKLKAALVRWHPDKWGKLMDLIHESDRTKVVEKVKEVTRRIIEEKKRYGQ